MAVVNKIGKVMKRNHALVTFDQERIAKAIGRAADSIGGFENDYLKGVNDRIFAAGKTREGIARFLSDLVVVCLNAEAKHLVSNFPPSVEEIQDAVLHVLASTGFAVAADAYTCFRWGHHWVREQAITDDQFVRNGYPPADMDKLLDWNREHGCDTVEGLNEIVQRGKLKPLIDDSLVRYESSLDEAASKLLSRIDAGDDIQIIWISGPSCSGKTTSTVKLTDRLRQEGLQFLMLNLDDYFWPLIEHPTDWINDRNYETPEALDIQKLNEHLMALLEGGAIEKPIYDFKVGRRSGTEPLKRKPGQVLLLDCLHGFYPPISEGIDPSCMFRLYIEAMNPIYEHQSMTPLDASDRSGRRLTRFDDVRLMRRMIRDDEHRSHVPLSTLLHWHYVREGELFSIIPLKALADHQINGAMSFDLPVLKPFFSGAGNIWPKRENLDQYSSFLDARIRYERIGRLLDSVEGLSRRQVDDLKLIPGDAVVREFIGNSTIAIPHNK